MDRDERRLLAETVRAALAQVDRGDADPVFDALGWPDMLAAEPDDAIAIVFEELGRANATASALDDVVAHALHEASNPAVLHPPFGAWSVLEHSGAADGLASARVADARELLVVVDRGAATAAVDTCTVIPVAGIDPSAGLRRVHAQLEGALAPTGSWPRAVELARRALAHQIAGASRTMLEQAREHALERTQFGRRIASFQAVRHRLAEALVAVEALDAVLEAAIDEPGYETAALAKAVAGRTARTVATHAQQVLAGIGFTTDHPFHRYLKRTILLDGLYGSADAVTVELGHRVLAGRRVPTLIEL